MAIKSLRDRPRGPTPIEVDLTGPKGNAYYLLGLASSLCKKLGYDDMYTERVLDEMRLSDYEGLLYTFDREFGTLVTLWR
ncbi:MAG: hypothetical protein CME70_19150 [Halobacteriovorax sp.]|nr:hypothetical protein [Halobacteriovorax sp.]|tara:strand:+ start:141 stop:380 length:240 start_codon:yes stop_codon:yes gene_type:complete